MNVKKYLFFSYSFYCIRIDNNNNNNIIRVIHYGRDTQTFMNTAPLFTNNFFWIPLLSCLTNKLNLHIFLLF